MSSQNLTQNFFNIKKSMYFKIHFKKQCKEEIEIDGFPKCFKIRCSESLPKEDSTLQVLGNNTGFNKKLNLRASSRERTSLKSAHSTLNSYFEMTILIARSKLNKTR